MRLERDYHTTVVRGTSEELEFIENFIDKNKDITSEAFISHISDSVNIDNPFPEFDSNIQLNRIDGDRLLEIITHSNDDYFIVKLLIKHIKYSIRKFDNIRN